MAAADASALPVCPWQAVAWERLRDARAARGLPHALLIAGPAGIGKRDFTEVLARALVCTSPPETAPCGDCPACRQAVAGTQPDTIHLEPAEHGKAVGVDGVRSLTGRLGLTGQGTKVAVIDPAEAMTASAANSLLKTLEEPPGDAVILLLSHRPGRLPATVRSRCQRVAFGLPDTALARRWLAGEGVADPAAWLTRAGGAPIAARALARAEVAEHEGALADALLDTIERGRMPAAALAAGERGRLAAAVPELVATVEDLIRLVLLPGAGEARLHRPERRARMVALAPRLDARALFGYLDALYRSVPGTSDPLRPDLQLQGLLADAADMAPGSRGH